MSRATISLCSLSKKGYSLDNQENITLTANSTLTNLTYGNHTIAAYANNTAGNMGASQIVNFIIEAPKSSEPFSLLIFVAVTAVLAVAVILVGRAFLQKPSESLEASNCNKIVSLKKNSEYLAKD